MSVVSYLSDELEQASLGFDIEAMDSRACLRRQLLDCIGVHLYHTHKTATSQLFVDPICYPWRDTNGYLMALPNDGGILWGLEANEMIAVGEIMTRTWYQDQTYEAQEVLRDLYTTAPGHQNPSIMAVMGGLLLRSSNADDAAAPVIGLKSGTLFEHVVCPDPSPKYGDIAHMPAVLQALAHTVRAQYEAVILDGSVFTALQDVWWKLGAVVQGDLPETVPRISQQASKHDATATSVLMRKFNREAGARDFSTAVRALHDWFKGPVARWLRQGSQSDLLPEELQKLPQTELATVQRLVATTTAILVQEMQARVVAAARSAKE